MSGMTTGRPPSPPATALGAAVRARRGDIGQVAAAEEIGIPRGTLADVERGAHMPSVATARKLARWLGWSVGQVFDAAEEPAG